LRHEVKAGRTQTLLENRKDTNPVIQAICGAESGEVAVLSWAIKKDPFGKLMAFRGGTWRTLCDQVPLSCMRVSLQRDHFGGLWMGSGGGSLLRFCQGELARYTVNLSNASDWFQCLLVDREGNLWAGSDSSGLFCLQPRHGLTLTTREGLAHDNVWTVCEGSGGCMWLGTDDGLSRFQNGKFTNFGEREGLTRAEVRSVAEDDQGALWVGTVRGLFVFREGRFTKQEFSGAGTEGKVRTIVSSRTGDTWVGSATGLNRLREGIDIHYGLTNGLTHEDVRVLLEDHAGDLWIGTGGGGLQRFRDGRFTSFNTTNGLSANSVWALHEDREGDLWIGTEAGLNRLKDGRITAFTTRQGLAADGINTILEDDVGRIWLSHDRGVFWVRKQDFPDLAAGRLKSVESVSCDETDGLASAETNGQKSNPAGCRARDGRLWFPTPKGVAIIDPARAADAAVPPLASVEQVFADGNVSFSRDPADRAYEVQSASRASANSERRSGTSTAGTAAKPALAVPAATPALLFKPGTARVLEFRFLANTFAAPEKARFKYRLLGLSDAWIQAGLRHNATFTDLRPGAYTFEVLAANHRGVWSTTAAAVSVRLVPYIYQTAWFRLAAAAVVLLLGYAGVRWRFRELAKIHRLQQQAALMEERSRIAKDLHDGLGADLTRLALLADLAEGEDSATSSAHRQKLSRSSREAARTLKEMIWIANPANDTVEGAVSRICQTAEDFLNDARIRCRFDIAPDLPSSMLSLEQRRRLLLLTREALNNIVKHASAAEVRLRAEASDQLLRLEIADNGCGFDLGSLRSDGLGLASMRRRVENLGGSFELESRPGAGTKLSISIRLSQSR